MMQVRTIVVSAFFLGLCAPAFGFDLTIVNQNPGAAAFQLVSALPYDRQVVTPAPKQYILRFSQPVRPDRSSIKVMDAFGQRVNDAVLESDGLSITTALPALPIGKYVVRWQAHCQCDSDVVLSESFHFTVK